MAKENLPECVLRQNNNVEEGYMYHFKGCNTLYSAWYPGWLEGGESVFCMKCGMEHILVNKRDEDPE